MILASILITDESAREQPLPPKVVENIDSFKQHHPGIEHRLFRAEETRAFIAAEYGAEVLTAYDALKPYAYKSDLARLCILLKHGGLYADLSLYFLRGWQQEDDKLGIFRDFFFAAPWQTTNGVFFAPPGHKALAKGIELICENVRKRRYGKTFLCPTGPICFGRALAMTCDSEEYVSGDSAWCREVPDHPGLIAANRRPWLRHRLPDRRGHAQARWCAAIGDRTCRRQRLYRDVVPAGYLQRAMMLAAPAPGNSYQAGYLMKVVAAFARVTGGDLIAEAALDPADLGKSVWEGQFALLTHDTNAILNYGNRFGLALWEMDWETLTRTPSRDTAPEEDRAARAALMAEVERNGFTRSYTGRRVSRSGRLFLIENATVFTLIDEKGAGFGTSAFFKSVKYL